MGPKAGLDAVVKGKIPSPFRESNLGIPALSLIAILTELSWLLVKPLIHVTIKY
jgi:hypothetical protein